MLGCIRPDEDVEVYLHRVTCFVWMINSWSVCDTFKFAGGQRFVDRHAGRLWEYLKQWMNADGEYEVRFGVVMSMSYFVDEAHLEELLACYDSIRHEGYYVKMAVAWALSVCFVKFPERTMEYLKSSGREVAIRYSAFFLSHSSLRWSGRCFTLKCSKVALNPFPSGQAAISPTCTGVLSWSQAFRISV